MCPFPNKKSQGQELLMAGNLEFGIKGRTPGQSGWVPVCLALSQTHVDATNLIFSLDGNLMVFTNWY